MSKKWLFSKPWNNEAVYVIGGGSSLKRFDWSLLKDKKTVGCNDAYKHGEEICKVCIFGDYGWWEYHRDRLEKYKGVLVTNHCKLATNTVPWLTYIQRSHVCFKKDELCWAGNTGVSAINLAFILGAKTVYLLGFDMGIVNNQTNWHDEIIHPNAVLPSSYQMFLERWANSIRTYKTAFPETFLINVNDTSVLEGINNVKASDFWSI